MNLLFNNDPFQLVERRSGRGGYLIASCGLGLNSVAGLILLRDQGDFPDAILFADTGGEKDSTYAYLPILNGWLVDNQMPSITVVRRTVDHKRQKNEEKYDDLYQECIVKKCLPSIAYYHRSCSQKWKHDPQEKWANNNQDCRREWDEGRKLIKAIFYDAGESHRVKYHSDSKYEYWHPLYDAGWDRDRCILEVEKKGLPDPPKSSCFFCPEMRPDEIFELAKTEPHNLKKALDMEANAQLKSILGLGKHSFSWRELIDGRVPLELVDKENRTRRVNCTCSESDGAD